MVLGTEEFRRGQQVLEMGHGRRVRREDSFMGRAKTNLKSLDSMPTFLRNIQFIWTRSEISKLGVQSILGGSAVMEGLKQTQKVKFKDHISQN